MSDEREKLEAEIADLKKAIAQFEQSPVVREPLEKQLADKEQQLAALRAPTPGPTVNNGVKSERDTNIATYQTINNFFGGAPGEDGKQLLLDYLRSVEGSAQELQLENMLSPESRRDSQGNQSVPKLHLNDVFAELTTDGPLVSCTKKTHRGPAQKIVAVITRYYRRYDKFINPSLVAPSLSRVPQLITNGQRTEFLWEKFTPNTISLWKNDVFTEVFVEENAETILYLSRPELALEAIRDEQRLVLLGEPGGGKSTVLRYVASALAASSQPDRTPVFADGNPVPIFLPLGHLEAKLRDLNNDPLTVLLAALEAILDGPNRIREGLSKHLRSALRRGGVILLLDGLDELSADGEKGKTPRERAAAAIRQLPDHASGRIVVTSRIVPYQQPGDWKLETGNGWSIRTIQPLIGGQRRTFIRSWYQALERVGQLQPGQASDFAEHLIQTLDLKRSLGTREMLRTPLLLTMLTILHFTNNRSLPERRAELYEQCVELLLSRWETVRTRNMTRPGLLEQLGLVGRVAMPELRALLHELAFYAQYHATNDRNRGRINATELRGRLGEFFENYQIDANSAYATFCRFLQQEVGLLQAESDRQFVFPHLTFQEYLAACYAAENLDLPAYPAIIQDDSQLTIEQLLLRCWRGSDGERWRTTLLLMAERFRQRGGKLLRKDGVFWVQTLAAAKSGNQAKSAEVRHRDAVLAALSFAEIGGKDTLKTANLPNDSTETMLRAAIVELLDQTDLAISTEDRIAAARVLAHLGDPRFPVEIDQWREEWIQRSETFGQPNGYWCYVPAGRYQIGGWEEGELSAEIDLESFWIARLPITVAQYLVFVEQGYGVNAKDYWTPNGWEWKGDRSDSSIWNDLRHEPNRPIVGVTWYESIAFCNWLTVQLRDMLPVDYELCLPTEAEWETAAAFDGAERRIYPWGLYERMVDRAISSVMQPTVFDAPVGCCPAGRAACGAFDLAGNVWELMINKYKAYPLEIGRDNSDSSPWGETSLRGGSFFSGANELLCKSRMISHPDMIIETGFRVAIVPRRIL